MNPDPYLDNLKSQMKKGTLEFCVLLIVSRGQMYTLDILKKLKSAELDVVEGTMYPLLNRLKREELLEYEWQESKSGPPRKYFKLTRKGQEVLSHMTEFWGSYTQSITNLKK